MKPSNGELSFIGFLRQLTFKEWGVIIGSINVMVTVVIVFHYLVEFVALKNNELSTIYIIFHFIGILFGATLYLVKLNEFSPLNSPIITSSLFTIINIVLLMTRIASIVPLLLFLGGFMVPYTLSNMLTNIEFILRKPSFNGKLMALSSFTILFMFVVGLLTIYRDKYLFPVILATIAIISNILMSNNPHHHPKETFVAKEYMRNKKVVPFFVSAMLAGFFWVASYYLPILYFEIENLETDIRLFFIIQGLTTFVALPIIGTLSDLIGRRWTVLIGFYTQTFIFIGLLLESLDLIDLSPDYLKFGVFPVLSTIGFLSASFILTLYAMEFPNIENIRSRYHLYIIFMGMGMLISAILLYTLFDQAFTLLSIIVVMILFIATNNTFQMEETLVKTDAEQTLEYLHKVKKLINTDAE